MQVNFSNFSPAARNVFAVANLIRNIRVGEISASRDAKGNEGSISDVDLAVATSAVNSPVIGMLQGLKLDFFSLANGSNINHGQVVASTGQIPLVSELPLPELDLYDSFTPCGRFVVHWAPNLAKNDALRIAENKAYEIAVERLRQRQASETGANLEDIVIEAEDALREINPDDIQIDPRDLEVTPQHIFFVALQNSTAPPGKLIESAYHGSDLNPARTLRERLGFVSHHVTFIPKEKED